MVNTQPCRRRWGTRLKQIMCVVLVLGQMGCRSVYRFRCTSHPTPVGVTIEEEMVGMTACDVKVPKDSPWIRDGKIEFTFHLPDEQEAIGGSRQRKRVVDMAGLRATNPLAEIVSGPFFLTGVGLVALAGETLQDEDADTKDKEKGLGWGLFGFAVLAVGAGVYALCGGDSRSMSATEVRVNFDEPSADAVEMK